MLEPGCVLGGLDGLEDRARQRRDLGELLFRLVHQVRGLLDLLRERHRGQQGQSGEQAE